MGRIICGFPGVGKTIASRKLEEMGISALDLDSSQFSWLEPGVRNPDFPQNYIQYIKDKIDTVNFILVSTHDTVLNALHEAGLEAIIVYPHISLKSEYMARYRSRRTSPSLISFIYDNWEGFIDKLQKDSRFERICLRKGNYLIDTILSIENRSQLEQTVYTYIARIDVPGHTHANYLTHTVRYNQEEFQEIIDDIAQELKLNPESDIPFLRSLEIIDTLINKKGFKPLFSQAIGHINSKHVI